MANPMIDTVDSLEGLYHLLMDGTHYAAIILEEGAHYLFQGNVSIKPEGNRLVISADQTSWWQQGWIADEESQPYKPLVENCSLTRERGRRPCIEVANPKGGTPTLIWFFPDHVKNKEHACSVNGILVKL